MTLPRYIIDWAYQNDELHSNGEWCKWKDVAPLLARIAELEGDLAEAIASHQKQNARVDEFENVFCDTHLDNLPKRCPACELAEARKLLEEINEVMPSEPAIRFLAKNP